MKKVFISFLLVSSVLFLAYSNPVAEQNKTVSFTDDCGRVVELPLNITRVAPSGNVATMIMTVIAPEYMTNINTKPSESMVQYLPKEVVSLPETGQLYGGKATLNLEQLIALDAQIIIDIGDYKKGLESDLDTLQSQVGIPCIFLSGSLQDLSRTFMTLGSLLNGKANRGKEISSFIDKTLDMAKANSSKLKEEEKKSVMFTGSSDGLGTNPKGLSQAQVLEVVGCKNAIVVDNPTSKGNGNKINMEQLYLFDPDVIVMTENSFFDKVYSDKAWSELKAVKNKAVYQVPCSPYCWLGNPPSLNMIIGIWYLGNLVYPDYYKYDMNQVADEIYNLFWGCDCNYVL